MTNTSAMFEPLVGRPNTSKRQPGMIEHKGLEKSQSFDPAFATHHSRYGHGIDVRATYQHLPFQPFWTWLTGKHLTHHAPRTDA